MKICLVALGAVLLSSGAANAEDLNAAGLLTQHVGFADLDLNSPAGLAAVRTRIRAAARGLCGNAAVVSPIDERSAVRDCIVGAIAVGERQISSAMARAKAPPAVAVGIMPARSR